MSHVGQGHHEFQVPARTTGAAHIATALGTGGTPRDCAREAARARECAADEENEGVRCLCASVCI